MVFYGQDTGCKLQENHDELGVLLPLKEFEHNILHHLEQVDGLYLYRAIYNLGTMNLSISASWFASATLIILALPLGLIFARIMTDKRFRYCT